MPRTPREIMFGMVIYRFMTRPFVFSSVKIVPALLSWLQSRSQIRILYPSSCLILVSMYTINVSLIYDELKLYSYMQRTLKYLLPSYVGIKRSSIGSAPKRRRKKLFKRGKEREKKRKKYATVIRFTYFTELPHTCAAQLLLWLV